jgi:hypothetical protein
VSFNVITLCVASQRVFVVVAAAAAAAAVVVVVVVVVAVVHFVIDSVRKRLDTTLYMSSVRILR